MALDSVTFFIIMHFAMRKSEAPTRCFCLHLSSFCYDSFNISHIQLSNCNIHNFHLCMLGRVVQVGHLVALWPSSTFIFGFILVFLQLDIVHPFIRGPFIEQLESETGCESWNKVVGWGEGPGDMVAGSPAHSHVWSKSHTCHPWKNGGSWQEQELVGDDHVERL